MIQDARMAIASHEADGIGVADGVFAVDGWQELADFSALVGSILREFLEEEVGDIIRPMLFVVTGKWADGHDALGKGQSIVHEVADDRLLKPVNAGGMEGQHAEVSGLIKKIDLEPVFFFSSEKGGFENAESQGDKGESGTGIGYIMLVLEPQNARFGIKAIVSGVPFVVGDAFGDGLGEGNGIGEWGKFGHGNEFDGCALLISGRMKPPSPQRGSPGGR